VLRLLCIVQVVEFFHGLDDAPGQSGRIVRIEVLSQFPETSPAGGRIINFRNDDKPTTSHQSQRESSHDHVRQMVLFPETKFRVVGLRGDCLVVCVLGIGQGSLIWIVPNLERLGRKKSLFKNYKKKTHTHTQQEEHFPGDRSRNRQFIQI